jgi:hypothetical protein
VRKSCVQKFRKKSEKLKKVRFQKLSKKNPSVQEGRPRKSACFEPTNVARKREKVSSFDPLTVNQPLIREKKYPFFLTFLPPPDFGNFWQLLATFSIFLALF